MAVQTRMTAREFLKLPESNRCIELIEFEVVVIPNPVPLHQMVVVNLVFILHQMEKKHGGLVFIGPLSVFLSHANIPAPDVMWIAPVSKCAVGQKYLMGAPDLVAEVFSPSTALRDKTVKFSLYERYGVREYWMLDAEAKYIEVWQAQNARFVHKGVYGPGATFSSAVFSGETMDVAAIFA